MRKLICLPLIIVILVSSVLLVADVHAATYVQGQINFNTTWTKTNSPYRLTGSVTVSNGSTLAIEPGVTVDLYSYSISVGGTLSARGTINNNIIFFSSFPVSYAQISFASSTNWSESTSSGCIIENSILSSVSVSTSYCSPKISNDYFTNNFNT
jgi:hypothetical protein